VCRVRTCAKVGLSCALFLGSLTATGALRADPITTSCPDREAVLRALSALSARHAPGAPTSPEQRLDLSTEDSGDVYRVSVNGRTRSYTDTRRDCAERARVAAVFAALVLSSPNAVDPEAAAEPAPPAVLPKPPPAPIAAPPALIHRRRWRFDAGAMLALAPGSAGPPLEPGVELGVAYVPGDFGAAIGLRLPAVPAHLPVGDATAHLVRYPLDFVARWVLRAPPFEGTVDAGAVLALLRVRQAEDSGQRTQSRLEAGLRIASRWQLVESAISPYVELFSEVIPVRYDLALEPTGVLAKTPGLWLGAALGVSADFD
jgi:hypothetical protein